MRTAAAVLCMRGKILPRPRRNELTENRIKKRVSVLSGGWVRRNFLSTIKWDSAAQELELDEVWITNTC